MICARELLGAVAPRHREGREKGPPAMASKVMDPDTLNENVKKTVYAVRGELYLRASELQKEGKKVNCCFSLCFL